MDEIVTVGVGGSEISLFTSFRVSSAVGAPLHRHPYAEMHLFLTGEGHYTVEGREYPLGEGDVILIPAGQLHATATTEGSRVLALQLDRAVPEVRLLPLPAPLAAELLAGEREGRRALMPTLLYLLGHLFPEGLYASRPNDDHAYHIHEYVTENYHRKIRLADLAAVLHLSERQTQRILTEVMGASFSELVTRHRIEMAERLAATTDMTRAAIASYVGYETYSGFRRALLRYRK